MKAINFFRRKQKKNKSKSEISSLLGEKNTKHEFLKSHLQLRSNCGQAKQAQNTKCQNEKKPSSVIARRSLRRRGNLYAVRQSSALSEDPPYPPAGERRILYKHSKKLLRASTLLILVLLVVGTAFFFLTKSGGNKTEAWFNDNWTYRKKIIVTNNTTAETDKYISFDAGFVLDTSDTNKFQADCGDIRFLNQAGETLEYYIVSGCGTSSTDIDVLIPSFKAGTQNIYMYYGHSSVENGFSSGSFSTEASNYTIGTPASEEVGPGPVAHWKLDEPSGTSAYDSSGSNYTATVNGATFKQQDMCVEGNCTYFDGDSDYITKSDEAKLDAGSSDSFTLEMWAKFGPKTGTETLFAKQQATPSDNAGTVVDTSTSSSSTANSFQRKTWYDGTRYWVAFNSSGDSRIEFWYSTDGTSWSENTSARISVDTNDFSIQADSSNAFINYTSSGNIMARKASSYPGTSFSWGTEQNVLQTETGTDVTAGSWYTFQTNHTSFDYIDTAALSATTFVAIYIDYSNQYGRAKIGTVSGTSISYGSEYTFYSGPVYSVAVAALSSTKFVVAYENESSWFYADAKIGSVSGSTISFGSSAEIYASASNLVPIFDITSLSDTEFVVIYEDQDNSNYGTSAYGSVSGTTITIDSTEDVFHSGQAREATITNIDGSTVAIAFTDQSDSDKGKSVVGTVSSGTISYGSTYTYNNAATYYPSIAKLTSSALVVSYMDSGNSNYGTACAGTISGTTISFGSEYAFRSSNTPSGDTSITRLKDNKFAIGHSVGTSSPSASVVIGETSGTVISYGTVEDFSLTTFENMSIVALDDKTFVVATNQNTTNYPGRAAVGTVNQTTYSYPTITSDSNSNIWVNATKNDSDTNYYITAVESTSTNDVSAWQTASDLDTSTNSNKYGVIVPRTSGEVYAAWVDGTTIEGKNYNGTSWAGSPDSIGTGSSGLTNNISATHSPSIGAVHLAYIDDSTNVNYRLYTSGSWQTVVELDNNSGNSSVSISLSTPSNSDVYVTWIRGNSVYYRKGDSQYAAPDWYESTVTLMSSGTNTYLTTAALDTSSSVISGVLTEGSGSPYDIKFFSIYTGASTSPGAGYRLDILSDGDIKFGIDDDSQGFPEDSVTSTAATYDDNQWHYISVVKNATTSLKLYIDGAEVASNTSIFATGSLENSGNVYIGIGPDGSTQDFNGFIDDIKFYPYARSESEIKLDVLGYAVKVAPEKIYTSNGLVGYWTMDEPGIDSEGETLTDKSGNNNTATLYGDNSTGDNGTGMDCTASGQFGTGCDFDGTDDFVDTSYAPTLSAGDSFTVSFWYQSDLTSRTSDAMGLGALEAATNAEELYIEVDGDGSLCTDEQWAFQVADDNGSSLDVVCSSSTVTDTNWHHLVSVFNAKDGVMQIYFDGELEGTSSITNNSSGTKDFSIDSWYLGALNGSGPTASDFFDGTIDEVRIYNRTLTPAEVQDLYTWAPGPVGYWPMEEGSGSTVYDLSGNGYDGTPDTGVSFGVGKYGGGMQFVSRGVSDYGISLPTSTFSFDDAGKYSFAMWIRPNSTNTGLFGIDAFNQHFYIYAYNGKVTLDIWDDPSGAYLGHVSAADITQNEWQHVAVTYDGSLALSSRAKIYINGVESYDSGSSTYSGILVDISPTKVYIGDSLNSASEFIGFMDEFQIYNYALNQKQIRNIMNARPVTANAVGSPVGSPIAHWSFDEGYGDTAYSKYGDYDGDLGGSGEDCTDGGTPCPVWSNSSKLGKALSFYDDSNTDGVYVADNDAFSFGNGSSDTPFSLSVWFNASNITTSALSSDANIILAKDYSSGDREWNIALGDTNKFGLTLRDDSAGSSLSRTYSGISTSQWYHAVMTYDGSSISSGLNLYINGKPVTTTDTSSGSYTAMENGTQSLSIGNWDQLGSSVGFEGLIDEVKIYNYALSADEVITDYNQGKGVVFGSLSTESDGETPSNSADRSYCIPGDTSTCSPPALELTFDQQKVSGNAQTVYDTSGNGNNGTTNYGANTTGMDCTVSGAIGNACEFDGTDDNITITDPGTGSVLDVTDVTLTAWVKINSDLTGWSTVVSKGAFQYYLDFNSSEQITADAKGGSALVSTTNFNIGDWYYIAYVWDENGTSDVERLYVNGVLEASASGNLGTTATPNNDSLRIGMYDSDEYFNGVIDQVRVYNYARTPEQIAWEYNQGGPVAWYKFDECEGTTINDWAKNPVTDAYYGNTGTLSIGATSPQTSAGTCSSGTSTQAWNNGTNGKYGAAMSFDGNDDYITIGDDLFEYQDFSVSSWVYVDANSDVGSLPGIVENTDRVTGSNGWILLFNESSGTFGFYVDDTGAGGWQIASTAPINFDTWYHVTGVANNGTLTIYLNGVPQSTTDTYGTIRYTNTTKSQIGSYYEGVHHFNGLIDDVRIYNYALTQEQIKTIMNSGAVNFE